MKILVTGGHITPAIRLLQEIKKRKDDAVVIGREFSSIANQTKSRESALVKPFNYPFETITEFKLDRQSPIKSLLKIQKLFQALIQSFKHLNTHQPDVVVSFGGYVSVAVCLAAKLKNIPIIIHEQSSQAGLANKIIAPLASAIAISFPTSSSSYPSHKTYLTGNLIRREFDQPAKKSAKFQSIKKPIIYITGGNQGSVIINQNIKPIIPKIISKYSIIHQTGDSQSHHSVELAQKTYESLPENQRSRYLHRPWLSSPEVAWVMNQAHLIITRSGANTITEIMHTGIPSILIPLTISKHREQLKNAQLITLSKAGILIHQKDLTPKSLLAAIHDLEKNYSRFKKNAIKLNQILPPQPAQKLYQLIKTTTLIHNEYK